MQARVNKFSIVAALLMLIATSAHSTDLKKASALSLGQDEAAVQSIMGKPGDIQFMANRKAWQYCSISTPSSNRYIVVWFENGKLVGVSDYRKFRWGMCSSGYKAISWSDFPSSVKVDLSAAPSNGGSNN